MYEIRHNERDKFHSFPMNEFREHCPVCHTPLMFHADYYLLQNKRNKSLKNIYPQIQTAYKCECLSDGYAWIPYKEGLIAIENEDTDNAGTMYPSTLLDIGYEMINNQLLSDFSDNETVENKSRLYHHYYQQQINNDTTIFRVPSGDTLLKSYVNNLPNISSEAKTEIAKKCEKVVELGISLNILSIIYFQNLYIHGSGKFIDAKLEHWLGFSTEIKDLLIFSGSPFWEHIKGSLIRDSVITCTELIKKYFSNITKNIDIENIKEARNRFFAHLDPAAIDEKTKGYIKTLYEAFGVIVKEFNRKHNKHKLHINFESSYIIPSPHTPCDSAFRNILQIINEAHKQYEEYQNDPRSSYE